MRVSPISSWCGCPVATEAQRSTYARALHRACAIIGGVPELAGHLGVAEADLLRWLEAADEPPFDVFLAAVAVILLHLDAPGRPS